MGGGGEGVKSYTSFSEKMFLLPLCFGDLTLLIDVTFRKDLNEIFLNQIIFILKIFVFFFTCVKTDFKNYIPNAFPTKSQVIGIRLCVCACVPSLSVNISWSVFSRCLKLKSPVIFFHCHSLLLSIGSILFTPSLCKDWRK